MSEVEAQEASGKGRESGGGNSLGALSSTACWLGWAALVMGKARWVLSSQLEQSDSVALCAATITPTRKNWPSRVYMCVLGFTGG